MSLDRDSPSSDHADKKPGATRLAGKHIQALGWKMSSENHASERADPLEADEPTRLCSEIKGPIAGLQSGKGYRGQLTCRGTLGKPSQKGERSSCWNVNSRYLTRNFMPRSVNSAT